MKTRIMLIVLLLAVAGGLAWYFLLGRGQGHGELKLYGNVDIRQVELSFRVPGKIAEVRVDEGDRVKAGDGLAALDDRPYRDALAKALGDRDVALANADKYHAGYRKEEIAEARALVAQLEAQVDNATRLAKRRQDLLGSGSIAVQERDDAKSNRDSLLAQLDSARKALDLQVSGFRVEDVASAEAGLRSAQAAVESAQTDLADTRIICPSGGQVLSRVREPGAMAAPGVTVLVVSLDQPVWVRAYVPEPGLGKVHLGMLMKVYTDSQPDKPYVGRVGFISPVAEFTPKNVETETLRTDLVYRLRIIIDAPDPGLRQGMPVTVKAEEPGK
jgi:HlyD family secretion protein